MEIEKTYWYLDAPISNSGRLKNLILEESDRFGWNWDAELVKNPDTHLISMDGIVVSSDSFILDNSYKWVNLAREIVETKIPNSNIVRL